GRTAVGTVVVEIHAARHRVNRGEGRPLRPQAGAAAPARAAVEHRQLRGATAATTLGATAHAAASCAEPLNAGGAVGAVPAPTAAAGRPGEPPVRGVPAGAGRIGGRACAAAPEPAVVRVGLTVLAGPSPVSPVAARARDVG